MRGEIPGLRGTVLLRNRLRLPPREDHLPSRGPGGRPVPLLRRQLPQLAVHPTPVPRERRAIPCRRPFPAGATQAGRTPGPPPRRLRARLRDVLHDRGDGGDQGRPRVRGRADGVRDGRPARLPHARPQHGVQRRDRARSADVDRDARRRPGVPAVAAGRGERSGGGHAVHNDLFALRLLHARVVDTAVVFPHKFGGRRKSSLKFLAKEHLDRVVQDGSRGHDCIEDARTAMELMLMKINCEDAP